MNSIRFTITEEEVQKFSKTKLSKEQIGKILSDVECDIVLWKKIEESIVSAVENHK